MPRLQRKTAHDDYEAFVEKFKPKKTTDDCYTPQGVYDVILAYAAERFGFDPADAVRPFWPGGDYESFDYPEGCVVVDNPPFSILSKIKRFYMERGIRFLLFAPSLTCLGSDIPGVAAIVCDAKIRYENGAIVPTSFATNMLDGIRAESCPELTEAIMAEQERGRPEAPTVPRYEYPDEIVTAAMLQRLARYGVRFEVPDAECRRVSRLESQRALGKSIYGGGLLLSRRMAEKRRMAERRRLDAELMRAGANACLDDGRCKFIWQLTDAERAVQDEMEASANGS